MASFMIKTSEGAYDLEASVERIGTDLLVAIRGGERPHIGAVAVAQPRPSLKDPQAISATASVFCLLGHKEDEMARAASEVLAAALNATVVVTAGIHWDHLTPEGIQTVVKNSDILMDLILGRLVSG